MRDRRVSCRRQCDRRRRRAGAAATRRPEPAGQRRREGDGRLSESASRSTSRSTRSSKPRCRTCRRRRPRSRSTQHQRALVEADPGRAARTRSRATSSRRRSQRAVQTAAARRSSAGPTGAELKASIMDENPGQPAAHGQRPLPRRGAALDHAAAGARRRCRSCPRSSSTASSATDLILLDSHAHIIVDFIDERLPT